MANVPSLTLNDGNKIPQVGFGLWKVDNATCADQVYNAIKTGYRLFDGACGMSDLLLGPKAHRESTQFEHLQFPVVASDWPGAGSLGCHRTTSSFPRSEKSRQTQHPRRPRASQLRAGG
jgi:hypothetical protein